MNPNFATQKTTIPNAPFRQASFAEHYTESISRAPAIQQNDYIGWITRAVLAPTKQNRLAQMKAELKQGRTYMKMNWRPSAK